MSQPPQTELFPKGLGHFRASTAAPTKLREPDHDPPTRTKFSVTQAISCILQLVIGCVAPKPASHTAQQNRGVWFHEGNGHRLTRLGYTDLATEPAFSSAMNFGGRNFVLTGRADGLGLFGKKKIIAEFKFVNWPRVKMQQPFGELYLKHIATQIGGYATLHALQSREDISIDEPWCITDVALPVIRDSGLVAQTFIYFTQDNALPEPLVFNHMNEDVVEFARAFAYRLLPALRVLSANQLPLPMPEEYNAYINQIPSTCAQCDYLPLCPQTHAIAQHCHGKTKAEMQTEGVWDLGERLNQTKIIQYNAHSKKYEINPAFDQSAPVPIHEWEREWQNQTPPPATDD